MQSRLCLSSSIQTACQLSSVYLAVTPFCTARKCQSILQLRLMGLRRGNGYQGWLRNSGAQKAGIGSRVLCRPCPISLLWVLQISPCMSLAYSVCSIARSKSSYGQHKQSAKQFCRRILVTPKTPVSLVTPVRNKTVREAIKRSVLIHILSATSDN